MPWAGGKAARARRQPEPGRHRQTAARKARRGSKEPVQGLRWQNRQGTVSDAVARPARRCPHRDRDGRRGRRRCNRCRDAAARRRSAPDARPVKAASSGWQMPSTGRRGRRSGYASPAECPQKMTGTRCLFRRIRRRPVSDCHGSRRGSGPVLLDNRPAGVELDVREGEKPIDPARGGILLDR